jgi:hypothetical protein
MPGMQEKPAAIDKNIIELIRQTVRESMEPFGLRAVDVRAGEDHDGDPVIFVEAQYDLSERPIDTNVTARLTHVLRDRLWECGETRFPHIRHLFDERQTVSRHPRRAKG